MMLAPMEGVTHPAFREIAVSMGGLDVVCTEFVRVSRAPLNESLLRRAVVRLPDTPLSVQVMGNDADKMAEAARHVSKAGADIVDINLGCPMPRVVRKGVGAAMLKDRALLFRVLRAMRANTSTTLSAKIRAGYDTADDALKIAQTVQDAGVDFITVHPRRRCDLYQGVADWRIIRAIKQHVRIPVVGNGDVWYAKDALRMVEETGCDAVMIGRPAMRNPWIFRQAAELKAGRRPFRPSAEDLLAHLDRVRTRYEHLFASRKHGATGPFKELVRWIARATPPRLEFASHALRARTTRDMMNVAQRCLRPLGPEELDLDAYGTLALERSGQVANSPPPAVSVS